MDRLSCRVVCISALILQGRANCLSMFGSCYLAANPPPRPPYMRGRYIRLSGIDCFAHVSDTSIFHCEAAVLRAFWLKGALKCHPGHGLDSFVGRVTQAPQFRPAYCAIVCTMKVVF